MKMMQFHSVLFRNLSTTVYKSVQTRYFSKQPRTPLIKFLGKRDLKKPVSEHSPSPRREELKPSTSTSDNIHLSQAPATKKGGWTPKPVKPHHPNAVDYFTLQNGIMHGRKKLSKEEMESIELGGAY